MSEAEKVYVGIDVSNATLDVAVRPSGESFQVEHTEASAFALVKRRRRRMQHRVPGAKTSRTDRR